MSKPARGTKRVCASCGARFYDLGRSPIICPACQTVYQISPPSRRNTAAAARAEPAKPEAEVLETPVVSGVEVISLDEAAEAEKVGVEEEKVVGIGDDDDDIPDDDADADADVFLEDDEEESADVIDIVKTDREADA